MDSDVKTLENDELRTQAMETISEWDDIEAHLGTANKASIALFHSRSDDIRVLLEEAVSRLELAGPSPDGPPQRDEFKEPGIAICLPDGNVPSEVGADADILIAIDPDGRAQMVKNRWGELMQIPVYGKDGGAPRPSDMLEFSERATALDDLIGGLRGRIDGAAIQQLLEASQAVYSTVLDQPGVVRPEVHGKLSERALELAEGERKAIEDAGRGLSEMLTSEPETAGGMPDENEPDTEPPWTWHVVAHGVEGVLEAKVASYEKGPNPDESKRLFDYAWDAYETLYNAPPNSVSVNVEERP